jgi:eukaryotic-like serine/threonine-protein kinase
VSREGSLERLVGQVLAARYRIVERVGGGAMGTVFRAEHAKIGRKLAVKVLHPRMLENEKYRRRFDREAELAGKMHHPNVIGVLDVGITPEGLRYLVMEYAEGRTLGELIAEGPMEGPRVLRIAGQLCDGLQHAHDQSLVHRDFKPDNVIVERDRHGDETPRILDFGVAIALADFSSSERQRLTTEGMVLGTPHYMAPEQAAGKAIDPRIDLFALGVMCFEMLTGVMPFRGTGVEIARAYLARQIPPMQQRAPHVDVDPLLEAFTRELLARSPDARPPNAKATRELIDLIGRDRAAAAQRLGVKLADQRRTLPSSVPPPGRAPSGTTPPPTAAAASSGWTDAPTEKMSTDPEGPVIVLMSPASSLQPVASTRAGLAVASSAERATALGSGQAPALAEDTSPDDSGPATAPDTGRSPALATALSPAAIASAVSISDPAPAEPSARAALAASVAMPKLDRGAPAQPVSTATAPTQPARAEPGEASPARAAPAARAYLATEMVRPLPREAPRPPRENRRAWWIAAALVGVGLCVIGALALRGPRAAEAPATARLPASAASAEPAHAPVPPAELAPSAPPGAAAPSLSTVARPAVPAPGAPAVPTSSQPLDPSAPTPTPTPAPAPAPVAPEPPAAAPTPPRPPAGAGSAAPGSAEAAPADPPTEVVAELYGTIGRALKRLDETHGQEATYDLWPRFRRIHIFEALRSREGRVTTFDALRHLEREIGRRSN